VTDLAAELEALERGGWEALCRPGGAGFYETIMADDGLMVFPGTVMDKPAALAAIRDATPWSTFELTDLRVTHGDSVAMITYTAAATRSGQPTYEATMSSVYLHRDGAWRLLLHQQSPT
jgi:hypothetical protein